MGAPRANSTTASAHTPLFCFSLPPSSCVYRSVITHSPSNCLFLFFICDISVFLFSHLMSVFFLFPFCCRSVVLRPFLRVSWHPHVTIFFLLLFYFPHCCVFHITIHILYYSVSFLPWKWWQENGGFTSGRVLFLDQILHSHSPVLRERESLLPSWHPVTKYTFSNMYTNLFSLYVCLSVFLWPLGVCVEWDVTGRLPCSTHKSNSIFFFLPSVWHDAPGCPRYTLQHYHRTLYVCGTLKPLF